MQQRKLAFITFVIGLCATALGLRVSPKEVRDAATKSIALATHVAPVAAGALEEAMVSITPQIQSVQASLVQTADSAASEMEDLTKGLQGGEHRVFGSKVLMTRESHLYSEDGGADGYGHPSMVKETAFYELLGVETDATSSEIKKAYYRRAKECHPDKHPGDPDKEAEFKALGEAYQTLCDADRRAIYDAQGRQGLSSSSSSYADAREVFAAVFGGPEFEPYIGVLGATIDEGLPQAAQAATAQLHQKQMDLRSLLVAGMPESSEAVQTCKAEMTALVFDAKDKRLAVERANEELLRNRVTELASALRERISAYVSGDSATRAHFRTTMEEEATRLRRCSMGEKMVQTIGYIYVRRTQKVTGNGAERFFEDMVHSAHSVGDGMSVIGSAAGTMGTMVQLGRDNNPDVPPERRLTDGQRASLEAEMLNKTMSLVWTVTKREIQHTLRLVVDDVLDQGRRQTVVTLARPAGVQPGALLSVALEGKGSFQVPVPEGVAEGAMFQVQVGAGLPEAELRARAEALTLVGGIFSGEKPPLVAMTDGLNQAKNSVVSFMSGLFKHPDAAA